MATRPVAGRAVRRTEVSAGGPTQADLVRLATGAACVQLWARVVIQVMADLEAGLRALRAEPAGDLDAAAARRQVVRDGQAAAAWVFGAAAGGDRAWICGWLGVEPGRLQAAVRREHGAAAEALLVRAEGIEPPTTTV